MKTRPILFSAPMIRALLDDRKTQTRRIVKPQPPAEAAGAGVITSPDPKADGLWSWLDHATDLDCGLVGDDFRCPYGVPGDLLIVRETFRLPRDGDDLKPSCVFEDSLVHYEADGPADRAYFGKTRVSIHMPRWASRLTLEITDVRVERLQDISEADAIAEGLIYRHALEAWSASEDMNWPCFTSPVRSYAGLWNHINGKGSWAANPWCWAVSFSVIRKNIDEVLHDRAN